MFCDAEGGVWLAEMRGGSTRAGLEGVELLQLDVVELESKCEEFKPKPKADVEPPPLKRIMI